MSKKQHRKNLKMIVSRYYIILEISKSWKKVLLDYIKNMLKKKLKTNKEILTYIENTLTKEDILNKTLTI